MAMNSCSECGYLYASTARHDIAATLSALARSYADRLAASSDDVLRSHPLPRTWSALEYACHVRDVLTVQDERIQLALTEDEPTLTPMGRDELVQERQYNAQQPGTVAEEITAAAAELAVSLERLSDSDWRRTAVYAWPNQSIRTLKWIGRHTVHEMRHHLMDFDRNTERAASESR